MPKMNNQFVEAKFPAALPEIGRPATLPQLLPFVEGKRMIGSIMNCYWTMRELLAKLVAFDWNWLEIEWKEVVEGNWPQWTMNLVPL